MTGKIKDRHKKEKSLRVRVTKERYAKICELIENEGRFASINSWLDWLVDRWITEKEVEDGKK